MIIDELLENKLRETFEACDIHLNRMIFANSKVSKLLPLTLDSYYSLAEDTISYIDQFIYRFSKLQDTIGTRLFPFLLEALAEPTENKAFIDLLNRLERLGVIDSAQSWVELRKIGNDMAHEYPSSLSERLEGINFLFEELKTFQGILENCRQILFDNVNLCF